MNQQNQSDEVIQRLIQWAEQRDAIRAVLLTSTRAIPHAVVDIFSDYDVILVVQDIQPFFDDRTWLNHFGDVLVAYWDPIHINSDYGIEVFGNVTQYEDGLKIDFTLWPVAILKRIAEDTALSAELDAGYRVLLDKDQMTESISAPTYAAYIPARPTNEVYQLTVNDFFSDAPYVAKCLWRDELLPAKWCLDYDMKHVYLRPMLEWRVQIDHGWSLKAGNLGKGLKKRLSPAVWSQLEGSYAGADIEENWEALFKTIALFRQVAVEVAEHLGYMYPYDLDQRVTAYLHSMRHVEHQATLFKE